MKGLNYNVLDSKGRIIVPSKYREELGETFTITLGRDCLYAYSQESWELFISRVDNNQELSDEKKAIKQRQYYSNAADVQPDKAGRLVIPPLLRKKAGLEKDIVVVGIGRRMEIWDKDKWDKMESEADNDNETDTYNMLV